MFIYIILLNNFKIYLKICHVLNLLYKVKHIILSELLPVFSMIPCKSKGSDWLIIAEFAEYEDAAEEFHPFIKFFATFDAKVL